MNDCNCGFDNNTELDCNTIQSKKWYNFHVPSDLFDEMNNYVRLTQEYLVRDRQMCKADFCTEANHIGLKIRMLLRQLEDQVNGLGEEFIDLQKTLCQYIAKMDKALADAEQALAQADDAIALAEEVSQGFQEFKDAVSEQVDELETRLNTEIATRASEDTKLQNAIDSEKVARQNAITDEAKQRADAVQAEATARQTADSALGNRITTLEGKADKDTTYALEQNDSGITLKGSDGSSSKVEVRGGAPEATTEDIMSIFE